MRIRVSVAEEDARAPSTPLALSILMGGILQSLHLVSYFVIPNIFAFLFLSSPVDYADLLFCSRTRRCLSIHQISDSGNPFMRHPVIHSA